MSEKIRREMRDHPERFDYGDLPGPVSAERRAVMDAQMAEIEPQWSKDIVAKAQADWTCTGFVPVSYLIKPPWLRMRAG